MLLAVCIIIGCTAEIDASAASSSSANLAVLLEYCLGALSLLLVLAIRIVGIAFFSFGIIEMINDQYTRSTSYSIYDYRFSYYVYWLSIKAL